MRKLLSLLALVVCLASCTQQPQALAPAAPEMPWWADATMYEVNVRQSTHEGTIKAFQQQHLQRLHKLGVEVIWLMPIHPIGVKNRKGEMGSYYSVQNYTAVSPELGTIEDLRALIKAAHALGIRVIIDWVANHTAWDHVWVAEHPDWFTKNSEGQFVPPVADWSDVIDLNFDNKDMRAEMIRNMQFWLKETELDGFRCDVAENVPIEFWQQARVALDSIRPIFFLAEGDNPTLHPAFDASYSWNIHHRMKQLAQGKEPIDSLMAAYKGHEAAYAPEAVRLQFISNHDENSWNGTMTESFGPDRQSFAVMSFTLPGMPLLYSGMEADINKRLRFFEKDTIDWANYPLDPFFTGLVALKKAHPSLAAGGYGGELRFHATGDTVLVAFSRIKDDDMVHVLMNLSDKVTKANVKDPILMGDRAPWPFAGGMIALNGAITVDLPAHGYVVLTTAKVK